MLDTDICIIGGQHMPNNPALWIAPLCVLCGLEEFMDHDKDIPVKIAGQAIAHRHDDNEFVVVQGRLFVKDVMYVRWTIAINYDTQQINYIVK